MCLCGFSFVRAVLSLGDSSLVILMTTMTILDEIVFLYKSRDSCESHTREREQESLRDDEQARTVAKIKVRPS